MLQELHQIRFQRDVDRKVRQGSKSGAGRADRPPPSCLMACLPVCRISTAFHAPNGAERIRSCFEAAIEKQLNEYQPINQ